MMNIRNIAEVAGELIKAIILAVFEPEKKEEEEKSPHEKK